MSGGAARGRGLRPTDLDELLGDAVVRSGAGAEAAARFKRRAAAGACWLLAAAWLWGALPPAVEAVGAAAALAAAAMALAEARRRFLDDEDEAEADEDGWFGAGAGARPTRPRAKAGPRAKDAGRGTPRGGGRRGSASLSARAAGGGAAGSFSSSSAAAAAAGSSAGSGPSGAAASGSGGSDAGSDGELRRRGRKPPRTPQTPLPYYARGAAALGSPSPYRASPGAGVGSPYSVRPGAWRGAGAGAGAGSFSAANASAAAASPVWGTPHAPSSRAAGTPGAASPGGAAAHSFSSPFASPGGARRYMHSYSEPRSSKRATAAADEFPGADALWQRAEGQQQQTGLPERAAEMARLYLAAVVIRPKAAEFERSAKFLGDLAGLVLQHQPALGADDKRLLERREPELQLSSFLQARLAREPVARRGLQHRRALEKYLDCSTNRKYVRRRLAELAEGDVLAAFDGTGGEARGDDKWLPGDSRIVLHAFCTFMDEVTPGFTDRHFIKRDERDKKRPADVAIVEAGDNVYFLKHRGGAWYAAGPRRENVFEVIALFIHYVVTAMDGRLGAVRVSDPAMKGLDRVVRA